MKYHWRQSPDIQPSNATLHANLVVGADSESVIVANRPGHDRKNRDDRRFDHKSGSVEHSQPLTEGAHFDRRVAGFNEACSNLDRAIFACDVDDVIPAHPFGGFREWSIGY